MSFFKTAVRKIRRFPLKVGIAIQRSWRTRGSRRFLNSLNLPKDISESRNTILKVYSQLKRKTPNLIEIKTMMGFLNRTAASYDRRLLQIRKVYKTIRSLEKIGILPKDSPEKTEYQKIIEEIDLFKEDVDNLNKTLERRKERK